MRRTDRGRRDAIAPSPRGERRAIQIGPRIRIGGTVGKIGQEIKDHLPSVPAMIGGALIPGGNLIAGALNGTLGSDVAKGATNAGLILPLAGKLGGASGGGSGAATSDPGVYTDPSGGVYSDDGSIPVVPGTSGGNPGGAGQSGWQQVLGTLQSVGGDIASFAKKYGTTAVEAAAIIQSAQQQAKAAKIASDAIGSEQGLFNAKAPLRTAGISGLLNPSQNTPDLSNIRALATSGSGNPFAKALPVANVATSGAGFDATGKLNASNVLPVAPSGDGVPRGTFGQASPGSQSTINYGGNQYSPAQWSQFTALNPTWNQPTPAKPLPVAPVPPVQALPKTVLPLASNGDSSTPNALRMA